MISVVRKRFGNFRRGPVAAQISTHCPRGHRKVWKAHYRTAPGTPPGRWVCPICQGASRDLARLKQRIERAERLLLNLRNQLAGWGK